MRQAPTASQGTNPLAGYSAPVFPIIDQSTDFQEPETASSSAEISVKSENSCFIPPDRLSWERHKINKVLYNTRIEDWMKADPGFDNWLRTCVMMHADNGCDETRCSVPDQWREDVGKFVTIVTADCLPGRKGEIHEHKPGVYRVMA